MPGPDADVDVEPTPMSVAFLGSGDLPPDNDWKDKLSSFLPDELLMYMPAGELRRKTLRARISHPTALEAIDTWLSEEVFEEADFVYADDVIEALHGDQDAGRDVHVILLPDLDTSEGQKEITVILNAAGQYSIPVLDMHNALDVFTWPQAEEEVAVPVQLQVGTGVAAGSNSQALGVTALLMLDARALDAIAERVFQMMGLTPGVKVTTTLPSREQVEDTATRPEPADKEETFAFAKNDSTGRLRRKGPGKARRGETTVYLTQAEINAQDAKGNIDPK